MITAGLDMIQTDGDCRTLYFGSARALAAILGQSAVIALEGGVIWCFDPVGLRLGDR